MTPERIAKLWQQYCVELDITPIRECLEEVERLRKAMQDIQRHYGHVRINNGTAYLSSFITQVLESSDAEN